MQRQFSGGTTAYDTTSMLSNPVFSSQHQTYPTYPLPVKPEPSSPNSPYQLNPYYLGSANQTAGGLYPSSTMNLNQIDYQGYRLSDMMFPNSFVNQDHLKQDNKYQPTLSTAETDPVLSHPLFGGLASIPTTVATPTDTPRTEIKLHEYQQSEVNGPMRIRRIKRPIPAGPSYPVHLWQFILELLGDHSCKDFIAWTGNDLEFKVINSRELARRWGRRKNNARMNFDKLSRAMRYYYEKNIIKHIPGQRLVYRYCRNPDDIVFTQLLKTAMGTLPPETRLIAPVTTNPHFNTAHAPLGGFCGLPATFNTASTPVVSSPTTTLLPNTTSPLSNTNTSPLLPQNSAANGVTEYMFSANCISQMQQHLSNEGPVKHMMAS